MLGAAVPGGRSLETHASAERTNDARGRKRHRQHGVNSAYDMLRKRHDSSSSRRLPPETPLSAASDWMKELAKSFREVTGGSPQSSECLLGVLMIRN